MSCIHWFLSLTTKVELPSFYTLVATFGHEKKKHLHCFCKVAGIYPPYTFLRVWSSEVEMKRFHNFYKNFKGFSKNLCCRKKKNMYKKNMNKTLSKTLLQLTEFCSSVFVIDVEQVNAPREMIMSLQYGISMLKVNNRNTRKRCEKCSNLTTTKNTRATSTGVFIDIDDFEYVNAGWVLSSLNDNYTFSAC